MMVAGSSVDALMVKSLSGKGRYISLRISALAGYSVDLTGPMAVQ